MSMIVGFTAPYGMTNRPMHKVVIIQRRMTHYRVPLFNLLRDRLALYNVNLVVVFGDPTLEETGKSDSGVLPWGVHTACKYWLNGKLCWQNSFSIVRDADLVVVTQENKLIFNYLFQLIRGKTAFAFWGHGRNFQEANLNSIRERLKRKFLGSVDWWFAYTQVSADVIVSDGKFSKDCVTVLNNSVDNLELSNHLLEISEAELRQVKDEFGIGAGPIAIVVASLHSNKRLDFLLEVAWLLRETLKDFQLLIVGDGPERPFVQRAVAQSDGWIHWFGAQKGRQKAVILKMANIILNPGMIGLGILDSFVAKIPMVTTPYKFHSPEIAYLENGVNGLIAPDNVDLYSRAVIELLENKSVYERMQKGCEVSAREITLEKMVDRFCDGIIRCLERSGEILVKERHQEDVDSD
jgi:glycosyltransferase involved in cell wall biosynthesis